MGNAWLAHHGILGQKWGVRRFQNPDGTLTAAGKRRLAKEIEEDRNKMTQEEILKRGPKYKYDPDTDNRVDREVGKRILEKYGEKTLKEVNEQREKDAKLLVGAVITVAGALTVAHAFKMYKERKSVERIYNNAFDGKPKQSYSDFNREFNRQYRKEKADAFKTKFRSKKTKYTEGMGDINDDLLKNLNKGMDEWRKHL